MNTKYLLASVALFTSVFSYANTYQHPETGEIVFDENSFIFSRDCNNTEAYIGNLGLDMVYDNLIAGDGNSKNLNCYFRVNINVPLGWYVVVSSNASITGDHDGKGVVTLEHTLAGKRIKPVVEFLEGSGSFKIDQPSVIIAQTECGTDVQLKTQTVVRSRSADGYVGVSGGSLEGVAYRFAWHRC